MYTTVWCAFCRRLKSQFARDGIEMVEVDIEQDPAAADYVMSVNGGFQTVPTVVFPDGSALTNPSAAQVKERLKSWPSADDRRPQPGARRDTLPPLVSRRHAGRGGAAPDPRPAGASARRTLPT